MYMYMYMYMYVFTCYISLLLFIVDYNDCILCLAFVFSFCREFGARVFNIKALLKTVAGTFVHSDKNVRAEVSVMRYSTRTMLVISRSLCVCVCVSVIIG